MFSLLLIDVFHSLIWWINSLRMSMWRSFMLLMHCLTDSSLQTSSGSNMRVFPYVSPAASTNLSFFFRSRMVAITRKGSSGGNVRLHTLNKTFKYIYILLVKGHSCEQHVMYCTFILHYLHLLPLIVSTITLMKCWRGLKTLLSKKAITKGCFTHTHAHERSHSHVCERAVGPSSLVWL